MNLSIKQHLKIGNYIKYIDEILHKCDKGIAHCKICPNEFVCTELEKDDFGLEGSGISDVLAAIQNALNKVPGYLHTDKRKELKEHIKQYIHESPAHEKDIWEDSILNILLDEKLANPFYKPKAKTGMVRTVLTCDTRISFPLYLKCICLQNDSLTPNSTVLHCEITSGSTEVVNQFIRDRHMNFAVPPPMDYIRYCLEKGIMEIIPYSNIGDIGLAAALCYYSTLVKSAVPENTVITGGLDNRGKVLQVSSLDNRIETVIRELHFIEKIIVPKNPSLNISIPENVKIIEVDNFEQTVNTIYKKSDGSI